MTIHIRRGILGDQSPSIAFIGITSDNTSSAKHLHEATSIDAEVGDNDRVNIIDLALTENNGGNKTYDIFGAHYNEYRDLDGAPFSSAVGVVTYINDLKAGIVTTMYLARSLPLGSPDTVNVSVGDTFTYNASKTRGVSYFWDETSFPNGVAPSPYDRRRITGIITQTGTYTINYEVANGLGTRITSVNIVVS